VAWGGYPQAERQRLAIARTDLPVDQSQIPLALLDIAGNFMFDPATHRDFLGSLLGTGIVREKVGDIIVLGERGAQAIVVPELGEFLSQDLTQVRSVPVKTRPIEWDQLKVRPPKKKEMTTVEASLRLDAVASAGFWHVAQQDGRFDYLWRCTGELEIDYPGQLQHFSRRPGSHSGQRPTGNWRHRCYQERAVPHSTDSLCVEEFEPKTGMLSVALLVPPILPRLRLSFVLQPGWGMALNQEG
jgi:hypothetical protein